MFSHCSPIRRDVKFQHQTVKRKGGAGNTKGLRDEQSRVGDTVTEHLNGARVIPAGGI